MNPSKPSIGPPSLRYDGMGTLAGFWAVLVLTNSSGA